MPTNSEKGNKAICHTCSKGFIIPYGEEGDYFFYQRRKIDTQVWTTSYSFCSKECSLKYKPKDNQAKLIEENAELKALWKQLIALDNKSWTNRSWIKYQKEWDKIKNKAIKLVK